MVSIVTVTVIYVVCVFDVVVVGFVQWRNERESQEWREDERDGG